MYNENLWSFIFHSGESSEGQDNLTKFWMKEKGVKTSKIELSSYEHNRWGQKHDSLRLYDSENNVILETDISMVKSRTTVLLTDKERIVAVKSLVNPYYITPLVHY
jgi:hypothetical protein